VHASDSLGGELVKEHRIEDDLSMANDWVGAAADETVEGFESLLAKYAAFWAFLEAQDG
jgi:hypothetical protein